jgi:hypothetical protein
MNMEFKEYPKVYSLVNSDWEFRDETEWILEWTCYIQEKIDGANLSVWTKDWEIRVWSRRQDVSDLGFRGAVDYVRSHEWIKSLLDTLEWEIEPKEVRLYWEWLVPHTITNYNQEAYNHFYLFDIEVDWTRKSIESVYLFAEQFWIKTPYLFEVVENPDIEKILSYVGKSNLWPIWEWVVIKNLDFVNKYGRLTYAKIVWEKFKEDNWLVFGNHQKGDTEMKLCNKYCVPWRLIKIINKIEQNDDKDIEKKDMPKIIWMLQNDIITEEAWNIQKEWTVNFKRLKWLIGKRWAIIAIDIIEWNEESVAFDDETFEPDPLDRQFVS